MGAHELQRTILLLFTVQTLFMFTCKNVFKGEVGYINLVGYINIHISFLVPLKLLGFGQITGS